jgi:hypothetical protein
MIEEENKIRQALDIISEVTFEPIDKEYVTNQGLHLEADYT